MSHEIQVNKILHLIVRTDNISFSRSKRVNRILCLCTRLEENLFSCKISSLVLLRVTLLHEEEEDEEQAVPTYVKAGKPCKH